MTSRSALIMLGGLVLLGALLGGLTTYIRAAAAPPDAGVSLVPLNWQRSACHPGQRSEDCAKPIVNIGVDKEGQTLEQFVAGKNDKGQTIEAWMDAGGDPDLWIDAPGSRKDPGDYHPIESHVFVAGTSFYTLRGACFTKKVATNTIARALYGGLGNPLLPMPRTIRDLGSMPVPTRTDGCAFKNHETKLPPDTNPAGAPMMVWTYAAKLVFDQNFAKRVPYMFPPVVILVKSPLTRQSKIATP